MSGQSVRFDGTEKLLTTAGYMPSFTQHTGMCWVKLDGVAAYSSFFELRVTAGARHFIGATVDGVNLLVYNGIAETSGSVLPLRRWFHAAMVSLGSGTGDVLGYLDGRLDITANNTGGGVMGEIELGDSLDTLKVTGNLAGFKLFNVVLNGAQIYAEMHQLAPVLQSACVCFLPLSGPSWEVDQSGLSHLFAKTGTMRLGSGPPVPWIAQPTSRRYQKAVSPAGWGHLFDRTRNRLIYVPR